MYWPGTPLGAVLVPRSMLRMRSARVLYETATEVAPGFCAQDISRLPLPSTPALVGWKGGEPVGVKWKSALASKEPVPRTVLPEETVNDTVCRLTGACV